MSWLGESLSNIKGQISNFSKDLLTESREESEEFAESEELRNTKKLIEQLESLRREHEAEINRLKSQLIELDEKTEVQDRQSKSLAESYDTLLQCKEEENKRLREQVNFLLLQQEQQEEIKTRSHETATTATAACPETSNVGTNTDKFEEEHSPPPPPPPPPPPSSSSTSSVLTCDAATEPDSQKQEDEEILDVRLELEERCSSYQNELFSLREELMTLQHSADEREVSIAKLQEEIIAYLQSEFFVDGQSAVLRNKSKHPSESLPHHPFSSSSEQEDEEEDFVLSALRQLASVWRDLVDRKGTLERAVTKLSVQQNSAAAAAAAGSDKSSSSSSLSVTQNEGVDGGSGGGEYGDAGGKAVNYLPKVDLYGLETIIEDERGEEDNRFLESELPPDDEPSNIAFIQRAKSSPSQVQQVQRRRVNVPLISNFTQTDPNQQQPEPEEQEKQDQLSEQEVEERIAHRVAAEVDSRWLGKEQEWSCKVEEKEERIKKLELERLKLEAELERLRTHLVEFEEQATSDALVNEEREKELRVQLATLRAQIAQALQDNDRIGDVKEELNRLTAERDVAKAQNSSLEDQIHKLTIQLQNLHFVLEALQKEKETEIGNIEKTLRGDINRLLSEKEIVEKDVRVKEDLLDKARSGLEAAQQLNVQIEEKTRTIASLKAQVQEKEDIISKLNVQVKEVGSNLDGKVDRYLLKNLIVGYFGTPPDKRKEVLRVIATVLDFNREDRQKTGLEASSLWPFRGDGEKTSLSEAFIRFMESESQPKVQVRIPPEEMARRSSRSSSSSTVSGESPIPRSPDSPIGVLNQADRSNSILKDVLSNSKP